MPLIKARHRPFHLRFFRTYTRLMLHRHFRMIRIHGELRDAGLPVLLIGNHFSWWDGFIVNHINEKVFRRKMHIMMLEEELRGRMFLNKAGAYSIRKKSRSALESLDYTAALLREPGNLVALYPQGRFQPMSRSAVRFERGIERILPGMSQRVQLVYYAALVDYFAFKRPMLEIYLRAEDNDFPSRTEDLEERYNRFLEECIEQQESLV